MHRQETPIWWEDDELEDLQSPLMIEDVKEQKRYIEEFYNAVYPHLFKEWPVAISHIFPYFPPLALA
jgi:hypothetical protein